ncbi:MAG: hypothetical protein NVSMB42_10220 [Herpetosiphon sp.]
MAQGAAWMWRYRRLAWRDRTLAGTGYVRQLLLGDDGLLVRNADPTDGLVAHPEAACRTAERTGLAGTSDLLVVSQQDRVVIRSVFHM